MLPSTPALLPATQYPSTPASPPELFWIGTTDIRTCLWPLDPTTSVVPLDPFIDSVLAATSRIWILDTHFEGPGGYAILRDAFDLVLGEARKSRRTLDVRILSGRHRQLLEWLENEGVDRMGIVVKGRDGGFHDRYALVDQELWHFGSTVGGGHRALSSVSRGWAAHAADFETLFRNWWG